MQGLILHELVKENFVYNNQQKLVFWNHQSTIVKARRLDARSILLVSKTLRAAKDERHLLSCLTTFHHYLFLRRHHGWIHEEIFEMFKNPEN